MENESTEKPEKQETEIDALARIVNAGFDRMDKRFDAVDTRLGDADRRFAAGINGSMC